MNAESNNEGYFGKDEPERVVGVVKRNNTKEWDMKVRWKKDPKTGKRPKDSIHSNMLLKKICPHLLLEFYESHVVSEM